MRQLRASAARLRWFVVVAATSVITLAASSPIYSAVSGRVGGGHASASPLAVIATAECSTAEALRVATQLQVVADPTLPNPVWRVLFGPFTGTGSQAMVAVFARGTCLPNFGWALFSFRGGGWQLVTNETPRFVSDLVAVGSDIRETVPVWRTGDSPCNPAGGTRARTWHWNSTSFVAGPWEQVTKGEPVDRRFHSPSGNIECWMSDDGTDRSVRCQSGRSPQSVTMGVDGRLKICRGVRCVWCGCDENEPATQGLGYGRQIAVGRFRCLSQRSGVTCTVVRSGRGFSINSTRVRRVGP